MNWSAVLNKRSTECKVDWIVPPSHILDTYHYLDRSSCTMPRFGSANWLALHKLDYFGPYDILRLPDMDPWGRTMPLMEEGDAYHMVSVARSRRSVGSVLVTINNNARS